MSASHKAEGRKDSLFAILHRQVRVYRVYRFSIGERTELSELTAHLTMQMLSSESRVMKGLDEGL